MAIIAVLLSSSSLWAQLEVPRLFSSGSVLQRDLAIPIWGKADANSTVSVTLNGVTETGQVGGDGRWRVDLPAMSAGGPFSLSMTSSGQSYSADDIYIGDVWLASGQSNMEWMIRQQPDSTALMAAANFPTIRQFELTKTLLNDPNQDLPANSEWKAAVGIDLATWSAVGYFFARDLQPEIGVPIGIINSTFGGSRIEAWMSEEMLGFDEQDVELGSGEPEQQPTVLYNAMIHPIKDLPLKGMLWYQGESNAWSRQLAEAYEDLFKTMITGWRQLWGHGDLPFIWVQLPNFGSPPGEQPDPFDSWQILRESQDAALSLPNTGQAISIDLGGNGEDIHPTNKVPVGERLSLLAQRLGYGRNVSYSGPRYRNSAIGTDERVYVDFDFAGSGLTKSNSDSLRGFALAGDDGRFKRAKAEIVGNQVAVWNSAITDPREIQYAWEENPQGLNLYNGDNLPAAPFKGDVYPGFRVRSFVASPSVIEPGLTSTLNWEVFGASSIKLDGVEVDSLGSAQVSPNATQTYTLVVVNRLDSSETMTFEVTIEVLDPNQINRSLNGSASASTGTSNLDLAIDGDDSSEWQSSWESNDTETDDSPEEEWYQVDLGEPFAIDNIEIKWGSNYAEQYEIFSSFDGRLLESIHLNQFGSGGTETINLSSTAQGQFFHFRFTASSSQEGYSIKELEIYGLRSALRAPSVSVTANTGNVLTLGDSLTFIASTDDEDGTVLETRFRIEDLLLSVDDSVPFQAFWKPETHGNYTVNAISKDDTGVSSQSEDVTVFVVPAGYFSRYEAESADYVGDFEVKGGGNSSADSYVEFYSNWQMTWTDVVVPQDGQYLLSFGFQLPFNSPKLQNLVINGRITRALNFASTNGTWWQEFGVLVDLPGGSNEIAVHSDVGWMRMDYLAIGVAPTGVANEADELPNTSRLTQNYPNPFKGKTTISYRLVEPGSVRLSVYDPAGRLLRELVNQNMTAGEHRSVFDATGLSSGLYIYQLEAGGQVETGRMVVLRD